MWDVEAPIFSRQLVRRWQWGWSALRAGRTLPPGRFLVLISVRGWLDPRAIVRLERLGLLKNPVASSGFKLANFRLVAWPHDAVCRIWNSRSGGYEESHLLGYNERHAVCWRHATFRRSMSPSWTSKTKSSETSVWSKCSVGWLPVYYMVYISHKIGLFFNTVKDISGNTWPSSGASVCCKLPCFVCGTGERDWILELKYSRIEIKILN
jgi:hypothetical protein